MSFVELCHICAPPRSPDLLAVIIVMGHKCTHDVCDRLFTTSDCYVAAPAHASCCLLIPAVICNVMYCSAASYCRIGALVCLAMCTLQCCYTTLAESAILARQMGKWRIWVTALPVDLSCLPGAAGAGWQHVAWLCLSHTPVAGRGVLASRFN